MSNLHPLYMLKNIAQHFIINIYPASIRRAPVGKRKIYDCQGENMKGITLSPLRKEETDGFVKDLQRSFGVAVKETFPDFKGSPVPCTRTVTESIEDEKADTYRIFCDGEYAGGAVVSTNGKDEGSLELFFVLPEFHNLGIGLNAWQLIEKTYPSVKVWRTVTPYFEKRNVNFYVNKCGFSVVEFFNEKHVDPDYVVPEEEKDLPGMQEYFLFEKRL